LIYFTEYIYVQVDWLINSCYCNIMFVDWIEWLKYCKLLLIDYKYCKKLSVNDW